MHDTLRRAVKHGHLDVTYPGGETRGYGPGGRDGGPSVAVALHDPALPRRILANADLALSEAYMDGAMTIAGDDLRGFMAIANHATTHGGDVPALRFHQGVSRLRRRVARSGGRRRARANVAHHYDLSPAL